MTALGITRTEAALSKDHLVCLSFCEDVVRRYGSEQNVFVRSAKSPNLPYLPYWSLWNTRTLEAKTQAIKRKTQPSFRPDQ